MLEERDKQSSATLEELTLWFKQNNVLVGETQDVKSAMDIRVRKTLDTVGQLYIQYEKGE